MVFHGSYFYCERECSLLLSLLDTGAVVDFIDCVFPDEVIDKIERQLSLVPRVPLKNTQWIECSMESLPSLINHARAKRGLIHVVLKHATPNDFPVIKRERSGEVVIRPDGDVTLTFYPPVVWRFRLYTI